jgi:hypothetical protein
LIGRSCKVGELADFGHVGVLHALYSGPQKSDNSIRW